VSGVLTEQADEKITMFKKTVVSREDVESRFA